MSEQKMELAALVQSSGLEVEKQNEIGSTLGRFFEKASEWSGKIDSIVVSDPTDTITMNMAREGRLGLRAMRLEAEKLVKEKRQSVQSAMSAFTLEDKLWLKAGQMMELTFKHLEGKLEDQEKFAERFESDRRAKLKADRLAILAPLGYFDGNGLDTMTDVAFDALVGGLKAQIEAKAEAERQAEADRIARELADRLERERIEAENARLKAEAEALEKVRNLRNAQLRPFIAFIRDYEKTVNLPDDAYQKELSDLKEAARQQAEFEQKQATERAETEAKLKAEREAREKLEREAKAKEAAELAEKARIEAQRIADEKAAKAAADKAAKAPKKDKLTTWIDGLDLAAPAEFADDLIVGGILQKFDAFKNWAKTQIDAL